MNAFIITTESGYDVYIGQIHVANVNTVTEAERVLRDSLLPWTGPIQYFRSKFMPCQ